MIYVVNASTLVQNADVSTMTQAIARQLRYDVAPAYGATPAPVVYLADRTQAAPGSYVIAVMDDPDQADALGWHTEDTGGVVYGRVFARPVLEHGGTAMTTSTAVSTVLSHEVLETFCDPRVNLWAEDGRGTLYAYENCDPVEGDAYLVTTYLGQKVAVSNFVLPSWFDPLAHGPFDHLGKLTAPFTMTRGGYVTTMAGGQMQQKFGDLFEPWRKELKASAFARGARRRS